MPAFPTPRPLNKGSKAILHLQSALWSVCLFVCSFVVFCFGRRDSSVIKEEIKAFLANRRISQAVVAQVTGKSWGSPFFILGNWV